MLLSKALRYGFIQVMWLSLAGRILFDFSCDCPFWLRYRLRHTTAKMIKQNCPFTIYLLRSSVRWSMLNWRCIYFLSSSIVSSVKSDKQIKAGPRMMHDLVFYDLLFCTLCCKNILLMMFLTVCFDFLQAEPGTDEVFAQITLLPRPEVSYWILKVSNVRSSGVLINHIALQIKFWHHNFKMMTIYLIITWL